MLAHAVRSRLVNTTQRNQTLTVELPRIAAGGDGLVIASLDEGLVLLPSLGLWRIASSRNPPREAVAQGMAKHEPV